MSKIEDQLDETAHLMVEDAIAIKQAMMEEEDGTRHGIRSIRRAAAKASKLQPFPGDALCCGPAEVRLHGADKPPVIQI